MSVYYWTETSSAYEFLFVEGQKSARLDLYRDIRYIVREPFYRSVLELVIQMNWSGNLEMDGRN